MTSAPLAKYQAVAAAIGASPHRLSEAQFRFFWENGYLGPLTCGSPHVGRLPWLLHRAGLETHATREPIPDPAKWHGQADRAINVHDPHLSVAEVLDICTHPSIVHPIAQLLGSLELAFFQSRFRVKMPGRADAVPWHQDVGENNGGYRADGTPVPSITVWLSVDGASETSGSLRVIPGSHGELLGDWRSGFHSRLEESGALDAIDSSRAVAIEAGPSEFYLFHSWTLHLSTTNDSGAPRSGLVLRFVAPGDAVQPGTRYTRVSVL